MIYGLLYQGKESGVDEAQYLVITSKLPEAAVNSFAAARV
jgi:hypothetical protein